MKDLPVDLLPTVYAFILELQGDAKDVPNELTLQVFADSDAGRNMHEYRTLEELRSAIDADDN